MRLPFLRRGPPRFGFYDESVGNGVGSDGLARLPLRAGAKRFFVNASTGSDTNTSTQAQNPATPVATLAKASGYITAGAGDQVLVAEGTTYAERMPVIGRGGFSPVYPLVWQTYDPADPLNEAKYGRPASRPVISVVGGDTLGPGSSSVMPQFVVIRGFDVSANNSGDQWWLMGGTSRGYAAYWLFENNILRSMQLTVGAVGSTHVIVRGNAIYGGWSPGGARRQGIFFAGGRYHTVEDNVFWHNGWSITKTRDDDVSIGGLGVNAAYNHAAYIQNACSDFIYRRNLSIDAPSDGGHVLADGITTDNVVLDSGMGLDFSGGTAYSYAKPHGVLQKISYNVIIGSVDPNTSTPRSGGFRVVNTAPGTEVHHNIVAHATNASGANRAAFATATTGEDGGRSNPTYASWHDNVVYLWWNGTTARIESADAGPIYPTYTNNIWDDPSDANGNRNNGEVAFPNPYDVDGLITAAGYAGADAAARKQALIDYAINHPEAHPGRKLLNLAMAGYGINHKVPE